MEVELEKKPKVELRSFELDQALKKPKTTVVELQAFERYDVRSRLIVFRCDGIKTRLLH